MEAQDETKKDALIILRNESNTDIRQQSAFSGSGSDDNCDAPPCSFSIHTEHLLAPQSTEIHGTLCPDEHSTDEIEAIQKYSSEIEEDEQPPVTWFITKPNLNDQATYTQYPLLQYNGLEIAVQQSQLCNLCLVRRKRFYCISCVNNGDYCHSNARYPGNLSEKKEQLKVIDKRTKDMISDIDKTTSKKIKRQQLAEDVQMCRQRINYLQRLVQATREKKEKTHKHARKLGAMNDTREKRLPLFIDKASKIRQYTHKYVSELDKEKLRITEKYRVLDSLRQNHIRKLYELVFPVEKVVISSNSSTISTISNVSSLKTSTDDADVIESLMADAMSTSYVHGQGWVTFSSDCGRINSNSSTSCDSSITYDQERENQSERIVYKIASPYLPADGDYSKFPAMVKASNDQVQSIIPPIPQKNQTISSDLISFRAQTIGLELSTDDEISAIHTISAGLTFTAQLVSQISSYLDVILPKYISCNEFGVPIASDYKFAKKVTKLNLNIIFLCLIIGVPPDDIQPNQSLHNLYLLFANNLLKNDFNKYANKNSTKKEKLAEKLYELSVSNASFLDRFSPTNEDLLNDSDEEGRDEEKFQKDMDDWEAVSLGGGVGSSDMMIVNLSQFNANCNSNWAISTSPSSPLQSPGPYGVGQAASSATSFVSSLIRGFTGATSPTNTSTTNDPLPSPKK